MGGGQPIAVSSCRREPEEQMVPLFDVNSAYTDAVTAVFSSTIAAKAWFATAAVMLAVVQVLTASRMWGKLERVVPLSFPVAKRTHRWSGRLAFVCTLPVFFHCVFILGFQTPNARVAIHAVAGTFVYGVLAAKLLMIRRKGFPHWALPVVGGSLATLLGVLWLTSSLWYFTTVRFGF
jgi:hypothetical protein